MSRSVRKTFITGSTKSPAEKRDKVSNHKRERRAVKQAIDRGDELMPHYREVSNPWNMSKDGRFYFGNTPEFYHFKRK